MDWNAAIEKNRQALQRVLSALVAMARLGQSASGTRQSEPTADGPTDCLMPTAECRPTLPRHLHRAILRLLRPAEAAARRLVIVAARGLVAPSPRKGTAVADVSASPLWGGGGGQCKPAPSRRLGFQLFDPLPRWERRRKPVATSVPRISFPGVCRPSPLPVRLPPAPDDPILAARLGQRLTALAAALDDLPRQARRFARWRASRQSTAPVPPGANAKHRFRRIWPLRPGRPPGQRAARNRDAVHDILDVTHGLAFWALEPPDTS